MAENQAAGHAASAERGSSCGSHSWPTFTPISKRSGVPGRCAPAPRRAPGVPRRHRRLWRRSRRLRRHRGRSLWPRCIGADGQPRPGRPADRLRAQQRRGHGDTVDAVRAGTRRRRAFSRGCRSRSTMAGGSTSTHRPARPSISPTCTAFARRATAWSRRRPASPSAATSTIQPSITLRSTGKVMGFIPIAEYARSRCRHSAAGSPCMGAVGQPRDGNPAAAYGILDTDAPTRSPTCACPTTSIRAAAKIRAAGLPEITVAATVRRDAETMATPHLEPGRRSTASSIGQLRPPGRHGDLLRGHPPRSSTCRC